MRELRKRAGVSTYDVEALQLRVSRRTLGRAEKGETLLSWANWEKIAERCNASRSELAFIEGKAKQADQKGWWEEYRGGMPPQFQRYVALETAADRIRVYESESVVGLCQTMAYMQASFDMNPMVDNDSMPQMIDLRTRRQTNVLRSRGGPSIKLLMTEGAIMSKVGGAQVYTRQLERLLEINERPRAEILVLTNESGVVALMTGAFTLLEFNDIAEADTVYVESIDGCRYVESRSVVDRYRMVFEVALQQAVPLEEFLR